MKRVVLYIAFLSLTVVSTVFVGGVACAQQDVPKMTKEDLKPLVGNPDVIIIDVRSKPDWEGDTLMIKGAVREDPTQVASWMDKYPKDKTLVFYCAWMNEATSASVARQFISKGYTKVYALKGGWVEWLGAKYPTEPKK